MTDNCVTRAIRVLSQHSQQQDALGVLSPSCPMEVELAMLKQLGIPVILWVHKRLEQCKVKGRLWTGKKGQ